jgi:hypothetical protein
MVSEIIANGSAHIVKPVPAARELGPGPSRDTSRVKPCTFDPLQVVLRASLCHCYPVKRGVAHNEPNSAPCARPPSGDG